MLCCVDESILDVVLMGGDQLLEQWKAAKVGLLRARNRASLD